MALSMAASIHSTSRTAANPWFGCQSWPARPILQAAATRALDSCFLVDVSRRELTSNRILIAKSESLVRKTRALIEECKQLLADDRSLVDEPKRLVATSTVSTPKQVGDESAIIADMHKAPERAQETLSIRVFQDGSRFGWRVLSSANELLGRGAADTELKARIAAFDAGMTYIDRTKGGSRRLYSALH
jgi:hypothetical protein